MTKQTPWSNRGTTLRSVPVPRVTQELLDAAKAAFRRPRVKGNETLLTLGMYEGHKQVLEWLENQCVIQTASSADTDKNKG